MLKNYIKIAIRNILKFPANSSINILGLATAVMCSLLVFLFIRYETSFDAFHKKADNIGLIVQNQEPASGDAKKIGLSPLPYGQALKEELPSIQNYTRISHRTGAVIQGESEFSERLTFTDQALFQMFDFKVKRGARDNLLKEPGKIVVTASAAQKYFGNADPVGQTISISFETQPERFIVQGVVEDPPAHSSISFDVLLPMVSLPGYANYENNFTTNLVHTYVEMAPSASSATIALQLKGFASRHWPENEEEPVPIPSLVSLADLHFADGILFGPGTPGNQALLYVMGGIALMVLLIACVNFVLLAIGRSTDRGKEVGIRKVMGAERTQLMAQFWGEMLIQITVAVMAGVVITEFVLPLFNRLADAEVSWNMVGIIPVVGYIILLILIVGVVAGIYPAVIQSGFTPFKTLASQVKTTGISGLGRFLIVCQYSLSISLIIGTVTMYTQLDYLKNKPLGYDAEQVVMIPTSQIDAEAYLNVIRDEAQTNTGIVSVSGTSNSFTQGGAWGTKQITMEGKTVNTRDYKVDNSYLQTLGIELQAGRDFSDDFVSDPSGAVIVNRAFVDAMGLADPVGKAVTFRGQREIVGVVENFHFQSLYEQVTPLALHTSEGWPLMHIAVRLQPNQMQESLDKLQAKWEELLPNQTFTFYFLDEQMDRLYAQEERWAEIITYVALLAILIACMGLWGLTSISTENRKKEIGIRKVLGATAAEILVMVSRNFVMLLGIAFLIATLVSYMIISNWLANYAYHVDLEWWMFALAGMITLVITMAAISYQSIKAALANPVESLRSE